MGRWAEPKRASNVPAKKELEALGRFVLKLGPNRQVLKKQASHS